MIVDACNKGIFKGLSLGDDGSSISLLQYADDALFFGKWFVSNARHLVRILDGFHDVSGFKINLSKSRLFGFGIPIDDVASVAREINCTHDFLPFTYLGYPLEKIRWQKIIADKKDEGFGVGSIKAKKLSLLGKWRWRFLNEKDALWRKVISKLYGSDEGFVVRRGSRQTSSTWSSIIRSCSELNQFDISLSNLIVKKISSGRQTLFWNDTWLKDIGPLKFCFPRLYALDLNKKCFVAERWSKIDDIWQGNWAWRRQPSGRALTDLSSLNFLIIGLVLDAATEDK
nr:RNA-directed DNA polymerase, eukaryota, reverse transcriptase zinc-binding domain protein [Tanacetum cinerariifolium]